MHCPLNDKRAGFLYYQAMALNTCWGGGWGMGTQVRVRHASTSTGRGQGGSRVVHACAAC
jgi:hypothetical protein